jgi:hypothetical protein
MDNDSPDIVYQGKEDSRCFRIRDFSLVFIKQDGMDQFGLRISHSEVGGVILAADMTDFFARGDFVFVPNRAEILERINRLEIPPGERDGLLRVLGFKGAETR